MSAAPAPWDTPLIKDWRKDDPQYVDLAEEAGEMRPYWVIKECPLENCSDNSWAKVRCWSFNSAMGCLDKLKAHAMASSHHEFVEKRAQNMIEDTGIQNKVIEFEEGEEARAEYREWADAQFARDCELAAKAATAKVKGKGKSAKYVKPEADTRPLMRGVKQVDLELATSSTLKRGAEIVPIDRRTMRKRADNDPMVTISWRQCELLRDSLRRARDSALNSQALTRQLSDQFAQEARVVEVAYQCVEEVLRESSRNQ
jgi:hypothetical protein